MNTNQDTLQIQPYLCFEGCCDEALEFYRKSLGAQVGMLMRSKDSPDPAGCPGGAGDKVMHVCFRVSATTILASDGRCSAKPNFQGITLSLTLKDVAEAERLFSALGDGGQVQMPFARTFFSPGFGMVADRFDVPWMIYVQGGNPGKA